MIASWKEKWLYADSGNSAGSLVYSAVSPAISRIFRQLQEIQGHFNSPSGSLNQQIPTRNPAGWA
jgi:hypothetical protein